MEETLIGRFAAAAEDLIVRMTRTRSNYWGEFALDIPLGIALMAGGLRHHGVRVLSAFAAVLLGLTLFTFVEYAVHRWVLHGPLRLFAQGHRAHHEDPRGYNALPFFLPGLTLLVWAGLLRLFIPSSYSVLLSGAMALGYVTYGLSHFSIHHVRFHNPWARRWAAHHHVHHYHAEANFGITTPLWDELLRTGYRRPVSALAGRRG